MPLYDYRCPQGHVFEQLAAINARAQQDCPVCGQASGKVPSRVALGGQADPGAPMEQMPQTWRGTYEGNPEYVGQLRRQWDARRKLEDTYGELRGDRRPVLAHEGRYHGAPLRAGDPLPAPPATPASTPGHEPAGLSAGHPQVPGRETAGEQGSAADAAHNAFSSAVRGDRRPGASGVDVQRGLVQTGRRVRHRDA